jgi:hypothetical protein
MYSILEEKKAPIKAGFKKRTDIFKQELIQIVWHSTAARLQEPAFSGGTSHGLKNFN